MKSVSQEAEARRESDWEKGRKKTSVVSKLKPKPADDAGSRAAQRERSVGKGNCNEGSNRNAGQKHESDDAPENPTSYTTEQFERRHEDVDSGSKIGGRKPREVNETSAAERHVTGEPGFVERDRRHQSVVSNRKVTEAAFDARRKRHSSI